MGQIINFLDEKRKKYHRTVIKKGPVTFYGKVYTYDECIEDIHDYLKVREKIAKEMVMYLLENGLIEEEIFVLDGKEKSKGSIGIELRLTLFSNKDVSETQEN